MSTRRATDGLRPICILGMSRTGTSLTTRVLNLLGVDLGTDEGLIPANEQNAKGYWERRAIYEINEAVLATMGGDYASPPPLAAGWEGSPALAVLERRARELIASSFPADRLWGFKDPRIALTLPFWRNVIPELRYVICVRSPVEVAASFERFYRDDDSLAHRNWSPHWLRSTATALVETHGSPRMLVFYDEFFTDLRSIVERLAGFAGRPVTDQALEEIEAFFARDLRHHWPPSSLDAATDPPETQELYRVLLELPPEPSEADLQRAETIAADLLAAYERRLPPPLPSAAPPAPPRAVRRFPNDLFSTGLDYSGIERDGWLQREAHLVLAGGDAADLIVCASVLPYEDQHVEMRVNGATLASQPARSGILHLRVPVDASHDARRIELEFAGASPLPSPDERSAAALLRFIRLIPRN